MNSPERYKLLDELFHAALRLPSYRREPFLSAACRDDPALKEEVEALIAAHEHPDGFMEQPPPYERAVEALNDARQKASCDRMIGPYRLVRFISGGGMSEVFEAVDTNSKRRVALKILPAKYTSDRKRVRRFQREAKAVSAINHPNIIEIYEIGKDQTTYFMASELVDGSNLRDMLRKGAAGLEEALPIAGQIAAALAAAHEENIVHRDIKPENIMVRSDGLVKVLDFGLAKLTKDQEFSGTSTYQSVLTSPGMVIGTLRYMSPEQADGLSVDARSDIFSLGIVFYELIAGRPPFDGDTISDIISAILTADPPSLASEASFLPPETDRIIGRMLQKNPEDRYQSCGELIVDLRKLKSMMREKGGTQ